MTTPASSPSTDTTTAPPAGPADVPDHQFGTVTPYLAVSGAAAALDFYREAFGTVEHFRVEGDDGRIGHADFAVGPTLYLSDEYPEVGVTSPTTAGATTVALHLEVDDVDAVAQAVAVCAGPERAADQAHGARHGTLVDPFGHRWMLSQQLEAVDGPGRLRPQGRRRGLDLPRQLDDPRAVDQVQAAGHRPGGARRAPCSPSAGST